MIVPQTFQAVFDVDHSIKGESKLVLVELAQGTTVEDVQTSTGCSFEVVNPLGRF